MLRFFSIQHGFVIDVMVRVQKLCVVIDTAESDPVECKIRF